MARLEAEAERRGAVAVAQGRGEEEKSGGEEVRRGEVRRGGGVSSACALIDVLGDVNSALLERCTHCRLVAALDGGEQGLEPRRVVGEKLDHLCCLPLVPLGTVKLRTRGLECRTRQSRGTWRLSLELLHGYDVK